MFGATKVRSLIFGFLSFIFFLVLLSGGTQFIFSSEKVRGWTEAALAKVNLKKVSVSFESAKTTWTGSLRYPFGIKLEGVEVRWNNNCHTDKVFFKTITVPFSVSAALQKETEIGIVRASQGFFETLNDCPEAQKKPTTKKQTNLKASVEKRILTFFENLQKIEMPQEDKVKINGFLFSHLKLFEGKDRGGDEFSFFIDRFKLGIVTFEQYESEWSGHYKKKVSKDKTHKVRLTGNITLKADKVNFSMEGRKKEGIFHLEAKASIGEVADKKPFVKVMLKNFPVSSLTDLLNFEVKFPEKKLRASWVDCQLVSSIGDKHISVKSPMCLIKGDIGSYNLTSGIDLEWSDSKWIFNKSIDIKATQISLGDIYPVFGRKGPDGIFGDFGVLNVDLSLMSLDSAYAEFELRDFSILFRSKGLSSFQKGRSARGTGAIITRDKIEFAIEEMELEKGEFEGTIEGEFNLQNGEVDINFEVPHLVLNPEISEKLFEIEMSFFELEGEGKYNYRKSLQDLKFKLTFDEVKAANWKLKGAMLPCVLLNKALDCTFAVKQLELSDAVFNKVQIEKQTYENLSGDLDYYKRSLSLNAFTEVEIKKRSSQRVPLLKAQWSSDQGLDGELKDVDGSYKKLNFRGFN